MSPRSSWQSVDALFEAALKRPADERDAFLSEATARPEVQARVKSLLERYESLGDFMEASVLDAVGYASEGLEDEALEGGTPRRPADRSGETIGPFRLRKQIGRGGSGVVYRAERRDGFDQEVALKLLTRPANAGAVLDRFATEQQVLAGLTHPNVAQIFDGGATDDGFPYFVMEYVDGDPLDTYCDNRFLWVRERLQLFLDVADAVQHAHRNLVVHRDLKPSNVLVTEDGRPKLLDFGIAKILDEEAPGLTRTGERWMTPEYAAPEQVLGEGITTATDVYQLGVVLYELLTGHRPYRPKARSVYEIERAVCEDAPTPPSTVVTHESTDDDPTGESSTPDPVRVSEARGTDLATLRRTLRGDLDAIIMQALRKEPDARYSSVEAFVDDIRRYLDGQPVTARRGTWRYQAKKFVRRHAAGVAASIAVVLLLLIGGIYHTHQVALERDRAQAEARRATTVSAFLTDLFQASDPHRAHGDSLTAQDLLNRGIAGVDSLSGQPTVQANLLTTFGTAYRNAGRYDRALPLLEQALAVHRDQAALSDSSLASLLHHLALTYRDRGSYETADSLLQASIALHRRRSDSSAIAADLSARAYVLRLQGRYEKAEAHIRNALSLQETLHTQPNADRAESLYILGSVLAGQGRYGDAIPVYHRALSILDTVFDGPHYEKISAMNNLGIAHKERGTYETARLWYNRSLDMARSIYDEQHPEVTNTKLNLSTLLAAMDRHDEAVAIRKEADDALRKRYGDDHPRVATALHNTGHLYRRMDAPDAAIESFRDALAIKRNHFEGAHSSTANTLNSLGALLRREGRYDEASRYLTEALSMRRATLNENHPSIASTLQNLGHLYAAQGACETAVPYYREARAVRTHARGADHWLTADSTGDLGACLFELGRYADAEEHLVRAHDIFQSVGNRPRFLRQARQRLIDLYQSWNRPGDARHYEALLAAPNA